MFSGVSPMDRIFGILFVVLAVWNGVEVYTEGMAGAFGSLLPRLGLDEARLGFWARVGWRERVELRVCSWALGEGA